jgi:hypothetical protein
MGLKLASAGELAALEAVQCGAAKKDLYSKDGQPFLQRLLDGRSLELYQLSAGRPAEDPIRDVMVEAKLSIGRFGGALRRLLFAAKELTPELVEAAQSLTEQITQKVLSVKAGSPPIRFAEFDRKLRQLLHRHPATESTAAATKGDKSKSKTAPDAAEKSPFDVFFESQSIQSLWQLLLVAMPDNPQPWLQFLRNTHDLRTLLQDRDAEIVIPANDLRVRGWRK